MAFINFNLNWFDFLAAVIVLAGFSLGNRRGMSKEVVVFLQWCTIVLVAALFYAPIGSLLTQWTGASVVTGNIIGYLLVAAVVKLIYTQINLRVGDKIESRHPFGRMEYYFGPVACGIRFACVLLLGMALLHSALQSTAQNEHSVKYQKENYGDVYFPTLGMVSQEVFRKSATGRFVDQNLSFLLITPGYQRQARL